MLLKDKVFIDADAFVAIINSQDSNHKKAISLSNKIKRENIEIITSSHAVGEAITVVSQEAGLRKAVLFGRKIYKGEIIIMDANRNQQRKALDLFSQAKSKNVRFTDYINMVFMDELGVDTIFSFDKHYQRAGYRLFEMNK